MEHQGALIFWAVMLFIGVISPIVYSIVDLILINFSRKIEQRKQEIEKEIDRLHK